MIELYQFQFSHYCEKARWALDYKGISYKPRNLLPGLHVKPARKLAPETCCRSSSMAVLRFRIRRRSSISWTGNIRSVCLRRETPRKPRRRSTGKNTSTRRSA